MIMTRGENRLASTLVRWLGARFVIYLMAALFAAQAFIGIAGTGKGGEWIIAALACEMFCALWMMTHHEWLPSWVFQMMGVNRNSRKLRIISVTPDIMHVSVMEASAAEAVMLRSLLNSTSATGTSFVMHYARKEVLGVLLSRDEYELLTAAAMVARDPERLEELLHEPAGTGISVEEAFRLQGGVNVQ